MTEDSPLAELLSKVRQRADTYAYFFEKIDTARWIRPLREAGFFLDPIGVEHLEEGYVRFPAWPESRALARIAGQDEDAVMEVILACPDTDNPRIHDDFVDAALQMSPGKGALVIPRIEAWLQKPYKLLLPIKAGKLLARLAEAGLADEAGALAEHLLRLERTDTVTAVGAEITSGPRFRARFDDWDYKTILEEDAPAFVRSIGIRALDALCIALHEGLGAEGEGFGGPPHDASYVWRPSIAEHEQNIDGEPKDFLVTAIREGADLLIAGELASVTEVVALLERQEWEVFDRLAMHAATVHAEREPGEAVRLLLRRDLFDSFEVSNEYSALIRAAVRLADDPTRATWLSWIVDGPDTKGFVETVKSRGDPEPTPGELAERADAWRWHRLAFAPVDALDDQSRRLWEDLERRFDEPNPLPFSMYTPVGSVSPLADDQAARMAMAELAEYASRVPLTERRYDSPEEGLASVLGGQARTRPAEVSKGLQHFQGLRPLYMRSLISGLEEAARTGSRSISWRDVLEVARWVLNQPREVEGGSGGTYSDLDPGWVWTINAIADLLEEGLQRRLLPIDLRKDTWQVLTSLVAEPETRGTDSDDPGTDSLNSTRGKTMHAIVLYADWLFEINRSDLGSPPREFSQNSPEVVEVLDHVLDPDVQSSSAVRAVFGMRAAVFMKLDPEWMAARASRIFSTDKDGRFDRLGLAAWSSYLKYSRAFLDLMAALRPQYELAVAAIPSESGDAAIELQRHLAEHLMVMYWHGRFGSEPFQDALLADFWSAASTEVRKRALTFVGHSLRRSREALAEDVQDRLKRLWDECVRRGRETSSSDILELQAFGWWVTAQVLDPTWVVPRTVEVLELAHGIDSQGEVISVLAQAPRSVLGSAAKALRLIVANDRLGRGFYAHQEQARALLKAALDGKDDATVEEARTTADILIARGFIDFRDLLEDEEAP